MSNTKLFKVISGGQSGADIGGLLGALSAGFPIEAVVFTGFVPVGRQALPSNIPSRNLHIGMMPYAGKLRFRTVENVMQSDATVVFIQQRLEDTRGSKLTVAEARRRSKPCFVVDLRSYDQNEEAWLDCLTRFIKENVHCVLNVAGERFCNEDVVAMVVSRALQTVRDSIGKDDEGDNP